jgi:hypothetical protein
VPAHLRVITRHALLTYARKHWSSWKLGALARVIRAEAWVRGARACWRGDAEAAGLFTELGRIAADLARGRARPAGRRLQRLVRLREERRAAAADRHHPQP